MIASYSPLQIKDNDSVNTLPQYLRLLESRCCRYSAIVDVTSNKISKQTKIFIDFVDADI